MHYFIGFRADGVPTNRDTNCSLMFVKYIPCIVPTTPYKIKLINFTLLPHFACQKIVIKQGMGAVLFNNFLFQTILANLL